MRSEPPCRHALKSCGYHPTLDSNVPARNIQPFLAVTRPRIRLNTAESSWLASQPMIPSGDSFDNVRWSTPLLVSILVPSVRTMRPGSHRLVAFSSRPSAPNHSARYRNSRSVSPYVAPTSQ